MYRLLLFILTTLLFSCGIIKPRTSFEDCPAPSSPDYSQLDYWSAHPDKLDSADVIPDKTLRDQQDLALADVFFIHPTTYIGDWGENKWNAPVDDDELNVKTDEGAIRNQASIFNGCYRVFAPRYRQAHYNAYLTKKKLDSKKAFQLAYADVKSAFEYYLKHENNGRPILIAGHSQGSQHAIHLLKDFFDGKPLSSQLVAAYIPGMPVRKSYFKSVQSCQDSTDIGCINTWRTVLYGNYPKRHDDFYYSDAMMINPLSWTTSTEEVSKMKNKGAVLFNFYDGLTPYLASAKIHEGLLWTRKPKFRGSFLVFSKDYHAGDFNLYYQNVRTNACERLVAFLSKS